MLKKENMLLSNVQTQPIKSAGRTKGSNAISKADGNTSGGGGWLEERCQVLERENKARNSFRQRMKCKCYSPL